jgi:hypothetical protein
MSSTAAANLTFLKWYYDGDESELFLRSNNMTGLQNGDFFVSKAAPMTTANTSNYSTTASASNNSGGIQSLPAKTRNFVHSSMPNLNSTKSTFSPSLFLSLYLPILFAYFQGVFSIYFSFSC